MHSRQQSGLACEECRARKLRCDREKPHCGVCRNLGVQCIVTTVRQPRGPKKGQIKNLQSRLTLLERRLGEDWSDQQEEQQEEQQAETQDGKQVENVSDQNTDLVPESQLGPLTSDKIDVQPAQQSCWSFNWEQSQQIENTPGSTEQLHQQQNGHRSCNDYFGQGAVRVPDHTDYWGLLGMSTSPRTSNSSSMLDMRYCEKDFTENLTTALMPEALPESFISDLMRSDLDQLYFDRVHISVPIIHQRRYFSRCHRSGDGLEPFACLQYAMWALAASVSSQFQHMQDTLYQQARTMLEALEMESPVESAPIEQAQVWTLLAIYEIKQTSFQRGWISVGRCLRLVQLMKLHEVDIPNDISGGDGTGAQVTLEWVDMEERRRVFWMAYLLDRCISLLNQLPMTLNEQVILTRLPAPEDEFQRGKPVKMEFLSEVIASSSRKKRFPFIESIVLITVYGRSWSQRQQCVVEQVYGNDCQGCWDRLQWLDSILSRKVELISSPVPCNDMDRIDPILLFTDMAAQATVISLCQATQQMTLDTTNYQAIVGRYESRAMGAAQKIADLSKLLTHLSYFKVHPFTPIPLYFCVEFLLSRQQFDASFQMQLEQVMGALRGLCSVNKLAQICISKLDKGAGAGSYNFRDGRS